MQSGSSKANKGSIGIESVNGRLRLNLPRQWFNGKQKRFALNLADTPENRKTAELKVSQIERDYALESFDATLERYKPQSFLTPVESITKNVPIPIALWERFTAHKAAARKTSTREYHQAITSVLKKLPKIPVTDALEVKEALEKVTSQGYVRRVISNLSAACKWGMKHQLVTSNPYDGMVADLPKFKYQEENQASAFTEEERDRVIEAFKTDARKGMNYQHYAPYIEFLFLTGCRPSEAAGLRWGSVDLNKGLIRFDRSIVVHASGKQLEMKKSKNNKERTFACSPRLSALLSFISDPKHEDTSLVFPSPKGGAINYANLGKNGWRKLTTPIKPDVTLYNCRDTFITTQINKGLDIGSIAKMCDTSAEMIEKHYADELKLVHIRPID